MIYKSFARTNLLAQEMPTLPGIIFSRRNAPRSLLALDVALLGNLMGPAQEGIYNILYILYILCSHAIRWENPLRALGSMG